MEHLHDEAVRVTIVTMKSSYDFFRSAAVKARSGCVRGGLPTRRPSTWSSLWDFIPHPGSSCRVP
jgi:hypothetical protein